MKWSGKPKHPELSREDALACRPVREESVGEELLENDLFRLSYPVRVRPWMAGLMRRFGRREPEPMVKRIELDELGSAVWRLIDGRRTVRQIVGEFQSAYRLGRKEAEVSVTAFLRELGRRGILGLK